MTPQESLHEVIRAAAAAVAGQEVPAVKLEVPPRAELGDYSTNAPLLLAPRLGASARDVAERLGAELHGRLGAALERFEVAGPGFLNLHLADAWFIEALTGVLAAGERFGAQTLTAAATIDVEFVSANPTGPLHIGHARHAAYGDALSRILEFRGFDVTREYYINDQGSQVLKPGESVRAIALGEPLPEGGYPGAYVATLVAPERARELDLETLAWEAAQACLGQIRNSLERFGVRFDVWFSERSLHEAGEVDRVLAVLEERGETYTDDGALWLR